jgi:hypothetical protein
MLSSQKKSRRGQAIVEFIPSAMVFIVVIYASIAYFRVMRAATIKQEVVRNIAFAKIANSGTLTTTPEQVIGGAQEDTGGSLQLGGESGAPIVPEESNQFIGRDFKCFTVFPPDPLQTEFIQVPLLKRLGSVSFRTLLIVERFGNSACR